MNKLRKIKWKCYVGSMMALVMHEKLGWQEFAFTVWVFHKDEAWMQKKWPQSQPGLRSPLGTWASSWSCWHWSGWPPSGCVQWGRAADPPAASRWRRPGRDSVRHLRWWRTAPEGGGRWHLDGLSGWSMAPELLLWLATGDNSDVNEWIINWMLAF